MRDRAQEPRSGNLHVGRRVGRWVGERDGKAKSGELDGFLDGEVVGKDVVGDDDGVLVGNEGDLLGRCDGTPVVGLTANR